MEAPISIQCGKYLITSDRELMRLSDIHRWLSTEAYWCKGVSLELVEQAFRHSFCLGVLCDGHQIGYARLVTDYATFGYLMDVFVDEAHRGRGLSKQMMDLLFGLDWVKGLRRIMLRTTDAQGLYSRYGFTAPAYPERIMSRGKVQAFSGESVTIIAQNRNIRMKGHDLSVTTDKSRMKLSDIHHWLTGNAYWSKGIPYGVIEKAFKHSFCCGILKDSRQIGFARIITDYTTYGYLADVYVEEAYRGLGLSHQLLDTLFDEKWIKQIGLYLVTKDAQGLYARYGFTVCDPEKIMELTRPGIYQK